MRAHEMVLEARDKGRFAARTVFIRQACLAGIMAGLAGTLSACSESTTPNGEPANSSARMPSQAVAHGQTEFVGLVGTAIEPGPAVRVLDEKNQPVEGVPVTFGPSPRKVVLSGPDGVARFGVWTLDTLARQQIMDARVRLSTQQEHTIVFYAVAMPGPAARLSAVNGNNQPGRPGKTLHNQLHVQVSDVYNNPVAGVPVSFSVVSGGGTIEQTSDISDYAGLATAGRWSLGTTSSQRVVARADSLEAFFMATFCESERQCDSVPRGLAYERDGSVWVTGDDEPAMVAANASRPAWSPDGSRLAFFKVNPAHEEEAICIARWPFSDMTCAPVDVLSRGVAGEMRVSWSPDGGMLALSRIYYGQGSSQLMFLDVATMTLRRHGTIDGSIWSASWSPDGKAIVIGSDAKVYAANAFGSDLQVLLPHPVWELAWAPDGQKIAVVTLLCPWDCYGADIALLDPKSRTLQTIERSDGDSISGLAWSPDNNSLAYSVWVNAERMRDIRILDMMTGTTTTVLTNASNPSWRP